MRVEIIFIPTAGGVSIPVRYGKELPWWLQLPPLKKWIRNLSRVRTYQPPLLKLETIARCKGGTFVFLKPELGTLKIFFLSGGASKRTLSNVELMELELLRRGVPAEKIFLDSHPIQTTEKTEDLVKFITWLSENLGEDVDISITAVVSWYYCFRVRWEIHRWCRKCGISVPVKCFKVFPPVSSWECLKREYIYNIFSEPFKIFLTLFPNFLKRFGRAERKTRGI